MADFGTLTLTTAGLALQQKAASGTSLTFTRAGIGDQTSPDGTDATSLTKLESEKLSVSFNSVSPGTNAVTLKFTFSNSGLSEGFYIRELGIFAADPDEGEILYAYANAKDAPDFLPAEGSNIVEEIFEVFASIGAAASVTATIDASLTFLPLTGGNMAGAINEAQVTMASAAIIKIGAASGNFILVTGTTTITAFDNAPAGAKRILRFSDTLTINYNAISMILPNSANLAVNAGDVVEFVSLGSGNWVCTNYQSGDIIVKAEDVVNTPGGSITATNVQNAINQLLSITDPLGHCKEYYGTTLPTRHLWVNGKTIGDASSGATALASSDTLNLFTVLWNTANVSGSQIQLYTSAGVATTKGTSAAADFATHKRMSLPDKRGRVGVGLDNMGGTSANVVTDINADILGSVGGAEKHTLTIAESPYHDHGGTTGTDSPDHAHAQSDGNRSVYGSSGDAKTASCVGYGPLYTGGANARHTHSIPAQGGSVAHNNMQPWVACNYIMRY